MARSFAASVLTVAGGTAVAQAIGLAALPLVTRLYAPESYGGFVVWLAWGGLVLPVACARLDAAIALPRRARSASALALGAAAVALAVTLMAAFALALLAAATPWLEGHGVAHLAWLVPLFVLQGALLQLAWNWLARTGGFRRLSLSRIVQAAVVALLSLGLVPWVGAGAGLLAAATLAGQLAGLAVAASGLAGSGFDLRVRPRQAWRLMRHFRRLAFFNGPHVLSDAAQNSGLPLLVAAFHGPQAAAYYGFAMRLLKAPLGLLSNAVAQVYYPRAAGHRADDGRLRRDALRLVAALSATALALLPVLLWLPERWMGALFGAAWADAAAYLRALAPWILSAFVAGPLGVLYLVKERFALDFALALAATLIAFALLLGAQAAGLAALPSLWLLSLGMTAYIVASTIGEFHFVIGRGGRSTGPAGPAARADGPGRPGGADDRPR
ncbi:MAG: lipopolysaccharide biosynthesis protein [Pseudomonadota bacterium]